MPRLYCLVSIVGSTHRTLHRRGISRAEALREQARLAKQGVRASVLPWNYTAPGACPC